MKTDAPFDLQRFTDAQEETYETVLDELRSGSKRTHWMWFIFPQHQALGSSPMAKRYGIASIDEAQAYLEHPVLGARLRECCRLVLSIQRRSAHDIFGSPDDLKLRSSMTLFAAAAPEDPLFTKVLKTYFRGEPDPRSLALL